MKYIFLSMIIFTFGGCFFENTSEKNNTISENIFKTELLQPDVTKELQPPKPPALKI